MAEPYFKVLLAISVTAEWKHSHFFDALHPVLNVFEGLLVCDVVH